jgi:hypothetical protein
MTTFKTVSALLVAAALSLGAAIQAAAETDANGDGLLTIDEVQAVYPEVTADDFSAMDLNADGALDSSEVQAAQEAGLMPA